MPRQGLKTETVVKAAALLLEESGYENLTLHKLASKLNIKPASLCPNPALRRLLLGTRQSA